MTLSRQYTENSQCFLDQAEAALGEGDLMQASEKLWGAAAQAVKSAAQRRGWEHDSHRLLFTIINRLAYETGDAELRSLFQLASAFHTNFYENWMSQEFIEQGKEQVKELVRRLENLS